MGETPFTTNKLRPGNYEIELEHAGYHQYTKNVSLTGGQTDTLDISMKPIEEQEAVQEEDTTAAKKPEEPTEDQLDRNSLLNKIAVGLFLAFSVVILVVELAGDD